MSEFTYAESEFTYAELAAENARLRALLPPDLGSGLAYRVGSKCPENLYVARPGEKDFELAKLPTAEYAVHIARVLNAWDWNRPDHSELPRLIVRAIIDPGSRLPRGDGEFAESTPHWAMRAVVDVLAGQGLTELKAADL